MAVSNQITERDIRKAWAVLETFKPKPLELIWPKRWTINNPKVGVPSVKHGPSSTD